MVNKKGSMELGVNAIVVLIIALVILGLGIGFITGLFNKARSNWEGPLDRELLPVHATSESPIAFDKGEYNLKSGEKLNTKLSLYNAGYNSNTIKAVITGCYNQDGVLVKDADQNDPIQLITVPQDVPVSSDAGYKAVLSASTYSPGECQSNGGGQDAFCKGTYICTVQAGPVDPSAPNAFTGATRSLQLLVNMVN